ncbi:tetratricopeptide repeat protein [Stella sp.]|uniref:tetratricopeptide repeat protein n=1 Tax=Stella sp. TaxID=2912054 RepID=UPI0035B10332
MPPSALLADPALVAYRDGRFAEAAERLRALAAAHPDDLLVRRYLGLALYGQKRYGEAAEVLEAAAALDGGNATTWLYLGLARYAEGRYGPATEAFRKAESLEPDARSAAVARSYRETIARYQTERTVPAAPQPRRWSLTGQAGIVYDDNVPLAAKGATGPKGSPRTFQSAWGGYDFVQGGGWRLRGEGFAFLGQNLRRSLDEYDQITVEAALDLSYQTSLLGMPARPGLRYAYQPTWEGGREYNQSHAVTASLVLQPLDDTISYLFYRYATQDYRDDGAIARFTSRDLGAGHQLGITQYYYFEDRRNYLFGGYAYLRNDAKGSFFDETGHRLSVGGAVLLPWDLRLLARAEYQWRDFDRYPIEPKRSFERQHYTISLTKPIAERLAVTLGFSHIDEDSNYSSLSYRQNVFALSLTYDF